jgi:hypothetical protein
MKKTFNQLFILDQIVANLLKADNNIFNTKFGMAYQKHSTKNYQPLMEKRKEGLSDIYLEHALTDATTGAVLFDKDSDYSYKLSKEGFKLSQIDAKAFINKFDSTEYDIEYIPCKELPEGFDVTPVKELVEGLFV